MFHVVSFEYYQKIYERKLFSTYCNNKKDYNDNMLYTMQYEIRNDKIKVTLLQDKELSLLRIRTYNFNTNLTLIQIGSATTILYKFNNKSFSYSSSFY